MSELDASFAALMATIGSPSVLRPASDGWGPFEVLCHIDGWHLSAARRLRQIARGEEPQRPPEVDDTDETNAAFVGERSRLSSQQLVRALLLSFQDLAAAAEAVPEAEFWRGTAGEEDSLAYFILNANGPEHYHEHMADLTSRR